MQMWQIHVIKIRDYAQLLDPQVIVILWKKEFSSSNFEFFTSTFCVQSNLTLGYYKLETTKSSNSVPAFLRERNRAKEALSSFVSLEWQWSHV